MSTQSEAQAIEHLEEARDAIAGLTELRQGPHKSTSVAAFYDSINQNMKLAEIEALLYIGDRLNALVQAHVCGLADLTPEELTNLVRHAEVA